MAGRSLYILSKFRFTGLRDIAKSVIQTAKYRNAKARTIISLHRPKSYD